jgi:hypothetical protein
MKDIVVDREGHERVRQVADCYVNPLAPGVAAVRYVTLQVTKTNVDDVLNALDGAGLMAPNRERPSDAIFIDGPQLEVVASTTDYITFEDVNAEIAR